MELCILGDAGQIVGARENLNGREKNGLKKSKERGRRAPGDNVLPDISSKRSRPFWLLIGARKRFCVSVPSEGQQNFESFRVFVHAQYMKFSCSPRSSWLFADALCTSGKDSISEQNTCISAIISPLNKLDLSQVS